MTTDRGRAELSATSDAMDFKAAPSTPAGGSVVLTRHLACQFGFAGTLRSMSGLGRDSYVPPSIADYGTLIDLTADAGFLLHGSAARDLSFSGPSASGAGGGGTAGGGASFVDPGDPGSGDVSQGTATGGSGDPGGGAGGVSGGGSAGGGAAGGAHPGGGSGSGSG